VSYDAVHLNAKKLCHLVELIDEDDRGAVKTPYRFILKLHLFGAV
jgi:hypothetical protein